MRSRTGLAGEGWRVALVSRSAEALDLVADDITAAGGEAKGFAADVRRPDEVDRLRAAVEAWGAPPTVLVNAAGVFGPLEGVTQSDPDDWITTLEVNVVGPYLTCRAFAPADGRGAAGAASSTSRRPRRCTPPGRWRARTRRARPPSTT